MFTALCPCARTDPCPAPRALVAHRSGMYPMTPITTITPTTWPYASWSRRWESDSPNPNAHRASRPGPRQPTRCPRPVCRCLQIAGSTAVVNSSTRASPARPGWTARQVHLIYDGALVASKLERSVEPIRFTREAVEKASLATVTAKPRPARQLRPRSGSARHRDRLLPPLPITAIKLICLGLGRCGFGPVVAARTRLCAAGFVNGIADIC